MNKQTELTPSVPQSAVSLNEDGRPVTATLQVAEYFRKRHDVVYRAVQNLECSEAFTRHNFVASEYKDASGRTNPQYLLTKDGFMFLVMGFTGKRAARIKEAYIQRFNELEQAFSATAGAGPEDRIGESLLRTRFLVSFDADRQMQITTVQSDALVVTVEQLVKMIRDGELGSAMLPELIQAAAERLSYIQAEKKRIGK